MKQNLSAAELVKCSAAQLLYKELRKLEWAATPRQLRGNDYAEEITKKEEASAERRGILNLSPSSEEPILLFFCIDLVKDNKFVEIKMVEDECYEQWYLQSSIMQATLYASLLKEVETLDTPKFRKKEGFKQEITIVPPQFQFELWFGEIAKYHIYPDDAVMEHYIDKALLVNECIAEKDFDECRKFDARFKHKEFQIYQPRYTEIS